MKRSSMACGLVVGAWLAALAVQGASATPVTTSGLASVAQPALAQGGDAMATPVFWRRHGFRFYVFAPYCWWNHRYHHRVCRY